MAGCAALQPAPVPAPLLASVPGAFEIAGRLSVKQGERGDMARLRWTHRPDSDAWVIASPFGSEVARIESDGSGAVLRRGGAADERAGSFAALTQRLLGAALEPRELAAWLHGGKPANTAAAEWTVSVDETQRAGAVDLAKRITATRGDTVVKLVVDSYRALGD